MVKVPFYLEKFNTFPGVRADFIGRVSGVCVDNDREATVNRLQPAHEKSLNKLGFSWDQLHLAEQTHGTDIAVIGQGDTVQTWPQVDGLITQCSDVVLGIYVADCGAVYIVDPVKKVLALLHSGKKGSEGAITSKAIAMMQSEYGSDPADLHVALAPCIRPPAYEVNFSEQICEQAFTAGVPHKQVTDCEVCTSSDLDNYYSYRMEKGHTGRMLALLGRVS